MRPPLQARKTLFNTALALSLPFYLFACAERESAEPHNVGADPLAEQTEKSVWSPDAPLVAARLAFSEYPANVVNYYTMDRFFDVAPVPAAAPAAKFEDAGIAFSLEYKFRGENKGVEQYLADTYANALLILKDGKLVYERYRNGTDQDTRFATFSISKSIVSLLVGIAIERGEIEDEDVLITRYAPEYAGTAYDGVTLRQALLMKSGVGFDELGRMEIYGAYFNSVIARNEVRCADYAPRLGRVADPGKKFEYSSVETCVIARVLERATGQRLENYMAEHLWGPLGAERDAYWLLDGPQGIGEAISHGGLAVTARDLARVGQMVLDGGRYNDTQIVPQEWIERSTSTDGEAGGPQKDGYGYQWWTAAHSSAIMGHGFGGQLLFIAPEDGVVIVKYGYQPTDQDVSPEEMAAFSAVLEALK